MVFAVTQWMTLWVGELFMVVCVDAIPSALVSLQALDGRLHPRAAARVSGHVSVAETSSHFRRWAVGAGCGGLFARDDPAGVRGLQ